METWQIYIVVLYGTGALIGFLTAFWECWRNKKSYSLTPHLTLYGAFVWGDMVVFGLFWSLVSLVTLLLNDWILFLLIISVFWVVRSVGETIYWFNQQFSRINRNPPEHHKILYKIFHNDSVWFVYQIYWQCITVVSLIAILYLTRLW